MSGKYSKDKQIDQREQTFNQGNTGPVETISTKTIMIALLRMIMIDIDLDLFAPDGPFSPNGMTPEKFYEEFVAFWLDNHPVLRKAEVRFTGNGFHVLLIFMEPILLSTDDRRKRWGGIVQVIQMVLPSDPKQPGINALTRPVGSVNSKNDEEVTCLRKGKPITEQEVLSLFEEMRRRPFPTLMQIWFGDEKVSPCPLCYGKNAYLEGDGPKSGRCYGPCQKVTINDLFQGVLKTAKKGKRKR